MTWSELVSRALTLDRFLQYAREAGRAGRDWWHDTMPRHEYVQFAHIFVPEGVFGSRSTEAWHAALRHLTQAFNEAMV